MKNVCLFSLVSLISACQSSQIVHEHKKVTYTVSTSKPYDHDLNFNLIFQDSTIVVEHARSTVLITPFENSMESFTIDDTCVSKTFFLAEMNTIPIIISLEETKQILGYECRLYEVQYSVKSSENYIKKARVWVSDVKVPKLNNGSQLFYYSFLLDDEIKGLPLEVDYEWIVGFQDQVDTITLNIKATKIELNSKGTFRTIPSDLPIIEVDSRDRL
ncbi:MAG: hypothetical protein SFW35_12735 [Chitinophagales bacterium]|nr:hypothetical protein [Chitinophagales bacterium]